MTRTRFLPFAFLTALGLAGVAAAGSVSGTLALPAASADQGAVVWLVPSSGPMPPAEGETAAMDQKDMQFVPHVLVVQVGTKVVFTNSDTVVHNVFSPDACAGSFNLGTWGGGEARSHTFDQPCEAVILCSLHPEMEAWVVAVPTSYFTASAADGAFAIEGVSDGEYTLKAWAPGMKKAWSETVTVEGPTSVDADLGA